MNLLLLNILLALAWVALTGQFTAVNFGAGFLLSFLVLWLSQRTRGTTIYILRLRVLIGFVAFFIWELIKANLRVTWEVLTRRHHMRPGVIAVPLDLETDAQIMLLTTLITLTPGTLSLDVSADRKTLYIHAMFIRDREQMQHAIKHGFERRVREVLR